MVQILDCEIEHCSEQLANLSFLDELHKPWMPSESHINMAAIERRYALLYRLYNNGNWSAYILCNYPTVW